MLTNWISNQSVAPAATEQLPVLNPATEELIDHIPASGSTDIDHGVRAARHAQPDWAALSPAERRGLLLAAVDRLETARGRLVDLFVAENGKPRAQAEGELSTAVTILRNMAELAVHLRAGTQQAARDNLVFQHRQPLGVAACVVPWNFPVAVSVENIAPNLAVGNTVVLKPSEKTPIATRVLVEEAFGHLPEGVCNVVLGGGDTGAVLVDHDLVDLVVFVGSQKTGQSIGKICGGRARKAILELGGKDPFIVDDTVDVQAAAKLAANATFLNAGQICTATERLYVHARIFGDFRDALVAEAGAYKLGDGTLPDVTMGPIIDRSQLDTVSRQVDDAVAKGAIVHCGHRRPGGAGFFYEPTVLSGVCDDMLLMQEETFGPVAPLLPFDDWDEALELGNSSAFGLAGIICTTSAPRAIAAVERLQVGMLKVNTTRGKASGGTSEPFKGSGIGHGYGVEFLHEITQQKSVHWRANL